MTHQIRFAAAAAITTAMLWIVTLSGPAATTIAPMIA